MDLEFWLISWTSVVCIKINHVYWVSGKAHTLLELYLSCEDFLKRQEYILATTIFRSVVNQKYVTLVITI